MIEQYAAPQKPSTPTCPFCGGTSVLRTFAEAQVGALTRFLCRTCGRAAQRPFSFYDLDDDLLFIFDSSGVQGSTQSLGPRDAIERE